MNIGAILPFTTVDYPDALAAVLFCQGCPWRCVYCHNPHLQPCTTGTLSWDAVFSFLRKRVGFLDAVVFSGGEPTLQKDIAEKMVEVRDLGFKVGLHTSGSNLSVLTEVLPLCDWVGMDVKAPFSLYARITGVAYRESVKRAVQSVIASAPSYEFRSTIHPSLLTPTELLELADQLASLGATRYVLQRARLPHDKDFYDTHTLATITERLGTMFSHFFTRF